MQEMVNRRSGLTVTVNTNSAAVDDILDGYYMPGPERKHKSPTRRLINHKNSTTNHKQKILDSGLGRGEYSQTYCISPGKSYIIEAQGGELPYDMADKDPQQFYSRVLNQDIKSCKVKMRGKLFFTWTQRPLLKIITSIKQKLFDRLALDLGAKFEGDIADALENEAIIDNIKEMVENDQIELIGTDNQPILKKQLTRLQAQQQELGGTGGDDVLHEGDSINIRTASPDAKKLDHADLQIHEQHYSDIQEQVVKFVKQNSLVPEAQNL